MRHLDTGYTDLNPVEQAVSQRRSVRAFKPDPVPLAEVRRILAVAARAPSGTNMQPWQVHVLAGAAKDRLARAILHAHDHEEGQHANERLYYMPEWREPYLGRRRKVGWDLYGLVGIKKGDKERMHAQHGRNYVFFDAPVGMIFTIDSDLGVGSWLDYGMFLENVIVVARSRGYETCPQAAFANYPRVIRRELGLADDKTIVCGMALGLADWTAPENQLVTVREPVDGFATFAGFETAAVERG